jgi:uncharacterized protein YgiM (DUF1202 family)
MKALRPLSLFLGLSALLAVSGCVVVAGPAVYVPPEPTCPPGYYWSPGYGCVAATGGVVVAPPSATYAVVNTEGLSLRSCPSTKCGIMASLGLGEQVQVLGYEGGWTHVWAYGRNLDGWVSSRYLN